MNAQLAYIVTDTDCDCGRYFNIFIIFCQNQSRWNNFWRDQFWHDRTTLKTRFVTSYLIPFKSQNYRIIWGTFTFSANPIICKYLVLVRWIIDNLPTETFPLYGNLIKLLLFMGSRQTPHIVLRLHKISICNNISIFKTFVAFFVLKAIISILIASCHCLHQVWRAASKLII